MNKQELKDKLDEYDSRVGYMKGAVIKISRGDLHDLIDQLDEPETLSQEWINKHLTDGHNVDLGDKVIYVEDVENLLVPKLMEEEDDENT